MKQTATQRLSQTMKMAPHQILLMKLLQIPAATLEQRIQEELEANPALMDQVSDTDDDLNFSTNDPEPNQESEDGEFELNDYITDYIEDDPNSYKYNSNNYSLDDEDQRMPISQGKNFQDFLEDQLGLLNFNTEKEKQIAIHIIGNIDEDGYLRREPKVMVDDLLLINNLAVEVEEIENQLKRIQTLDPPGVGAKDLRECLLIQLKVIRFKNGTNENAPLDHAIAIIDKSFEEFSKKHYKKLQRSLSISESELKLAIDEILKLNPKPASGYNSGRNDRGSTYVIPDFIVINRDGELELTLNTKNSPELHINSQYQNILRGYEEKKGKAKSTATDTVRFIRDKINSAKWFIDAIQQRKDTMYKTMYCILRYQYDYFITGDQSSLKPMILKDIAELIDLDISTVSRVANSKFVQTEFGTKRLKDFFSESLTTEDGQEVSTFAVKNTLQKIIDKENKVKPLSDEKLKNLLHKTGYKIARRTVAKYREQLNIPVARLRKELA